MHWCIAAATIGVLVPLIMPDLMAGVGWPWRLIFLGGASTLFAEQAVVVGQRASHEYVAATRGLNRTERAQAITASVRGDVPTSAAVLVAALRIGDIRLGHGRSSSKRVAVGYGLVFLGWVGLTVAHVSTDSPRQTVLKGVVTALIAIAGVRGWSVARRVERRITLLQNASENFPGAAGRTAAAVARFVVSHPDMLDPGFISASSGGPALADYQRWSEQLRRYATSVSASGVAPRVRDVADLSDRAVAVVREARADPAGWQDPSQERHRSDYGAIVGQLITEVKALDGPCPRRR
ncbi:hypothetical protein [Mycobacterium intracellulare]|uniref:hypothetical protein n=1 Tax=Mycobacterium intracellulare TaxID=1767 RepID=UPI001E56A4FB|nr:hypothetical protein [Mycobacterium intracellulare]